MGIPTKQSSGPAAAEPGEARAREAGAGEPPRGRLRAVGDVLRREPGRVVSAIGAVFLAASLKLNWYDVRKPADGTVTTFSGWGYLERVDLAIFLLALGALAVAALPWARSREARGVLGLAAAAIVLARIVKPPGADELVTVLPGARLALAASLAIVAGTAIDLVPKRLAGPEPPGWLDRLAGIAPLAIGVPVLLGIAVSVVDLIAAGQPDLGFSETRNRDSEAFWLDWSLYADSDEDYTQVTYTPLHPIIAGLLSHVVFWTGWPTLLVILGGVALTAGAASLAYRPRDPRWLALLEAAGVAGIAWFLVSTLRVNSLYDARSDMLAWAFALGGLALLPRAVRGSNRAAVGAVVLISAGYWTKQPAVAAGIAAAVWLAGGAALRLIPWRRALAIVAGLGGLNLALLGFFSLVTGGWAYYYNFEQPEETSRGKVDATYLTGFVDRLTDDLRIVFLFVGVLWLALALLRPFPRKLSERGQIAVVLAVFLPVTLALSTFVQTRLGTSQNQDIGAAWALVLLGAVAWGALRARAVTSAAAVAATALLFVAALTTLPDREPTDRASNGGGPAHPELFPEHDWKPKPAEILAQARGRTVFHPLYTDLDLRDEGIVYPEWQNVQDLLAAGKQPGYLVEAFLDRRFDRAYLFDPATTVGPWNFGNPDYASSYGRYEEQYFWKMNEVIKARYRPVPGGGPVLMERRPGPEPATWMRSCFGPFELGGVDWRINHGGGFWCRSGQTMTMRRIRFESSDMRTDEPVERVEGELTMTLPRDTGTADLYFETEDGTARWTVHAEAQGRGRVAITAFQNGGQTAALPPVRAQAESGRVAVRLFFSKPAGTDLGVSRLADGVLVRPPALGEDPVLRVSASRNSLAAFDFSRLRLSG